ncbi:hypothetical protein I79_013129 [Cricetulus griseus]|uniref:Uncharacterized protein n=1 Tax=Cricetulus griseus TaxID=10029 RepID=G3HQM4_CRIGR|nr:hypothetical protein I79_013129 [Cricetulus griseus]
MKKCREDIVKTEAGTGVLNCKTRTPSVLGLQPKPTRGKNKTLLIILDYTFGPSELW